MNGIDLSPKQMCCPATLHLGPIVSSMDTMHIYKIITHLGKVIGFSTTHCVQRQHAKLRDPRHAVRRLATQQEDPIGVIVYRSSMVT